MNKLLLLSRIKDLTFVFKSSTEYNIDFIYHKKKCELSFCSRFKIYVLMVLTLAFVFKIITLIIFCAVKKVSFTQSRNFCTVQDIFFYQGIFRVKKFFQG